MCVLKGFPTTPAKTTTTSFPFGVWFANATTLYVADEGNGTNTFDPASGKFTAAAAQTTAGLQKWVFDAGLGAWKLAYVLQAGLNLGVPYTVDRYPTGQNPKTGLPWAPAADGLRNITGRVNRNQWVTKAIRGRHQGRLVLGFCPVGNVDGIGDAEIEASLQHVSQLLQAPEPRSNTHFCRPAVVCAAAA